MESSNRNIQTSIFKHITSDSIGDLITTGSIQWTRRSTADHMSSILAGVIYLNQNECISIEIDNVSNNNNIIIRDDGLIILKLL